MVSVWGGSVCANSLTTILVLACSGSVPGDPPNVVLDCQLLGFPKSAAGFKTSKVLPLPLFWASHSIIVFKVHDKVSILVGYSMYSPWLLSLPVVHSPATLVASD